MSSARNVHFERSRALGSMGNNGLGFIDLPFINIRSPRQQKLLLGATLVYAGLGFPGAKSAGLAVKNIAKFHKRDAAQNAAVGVGVILIVQGVLSA